MLDAYEWVGKNGIVEDGDYPASYKARKGECKSVSDDKKKFIVKSQKEEDEVSNTRMKELL